MSEQALEDTLAKVQAGIEAAKGGEVESDEQEQQLELIDVDVDDDGEAEDADDIEVEDQEELAADEQKALDLGWTPFREYIDKGGDPSMYRGAKAFLQFKEMQDKYKGRADQATDKVSELESEMKKMQSMFIEQLKSQKQKARQELEKQLKMAKEDLDVDRVAELSTELNRYDDVTEDEPEDVADESPVTEDQKRPLINLINANPILDRSSDEFDADVATLLSSKLDRRLGAIPISELTAERLQAVIDQEWKATQQKLGLSKTRQTRTPPNTAGAQPTKRTGKKVARMDKDEKSMYDFLMKSNPQAAKEYAKTIQERS